MKRAFGLVRLLLRLVGYAEAAAIVLLLANIVLNISVQVVSRYAFDLPLVWVEEFATYSFIWATFLGASLALKLGRHVKIETAVLLAPPRGQALVRAVQYAIILVILATMAPPLVSAIDIEMRRMTISLPVDVPTAWFFSIPLLIAVCSMLATAAYLLLAALAEAATGAASPPILSFDDPHEAEELRELEQALERGQP